MEENETLYVGRSMVSIDCFFMASMHLLPQHCQNSFLTALTITASADRLQQRACELLPC